MAGQKRRVILALWLCHARFVSHRCDLLRGLVGRWKVLCCSDVEHLFHHPTSAIQSVVCLTEQRPMHPGARCVKTYISSVVAILALLQDVSMPVEQLSAYLAMVNKNSHHWQYYTPHHSPVFLCRKTSVVVPDQCVFLPSPQPISRQLLKIVFHYQQKGMNHSCECQTAFSKTAAGLGFSCAAVSGERREWSEKTENTLLMPEAKRVLGWEWGNTDSNENSLQVRCAQNKLEKQVGGGSTGHSGCRPLD